jgi:O-antigen/teichoic acid export membrane protein
MIQISRKDIAWSYIAQFFSIASGVITLPLILRMLSTEEIAMNYLMLTIGSLVALFDFGFSPQFGRNITYVFSGAKELKKEGIVQTLTNNEVDYRLLVQMIGTARFVYRRLSFVVLTAMLTLGTLYIHRVTEGFSNINNSLLIWIIFCISTFFNIYYSYYSSLLIGKGLIMESKKAMLYSKLSYIFLTFVLLLSGLGLIGVTVANLIAPFVNRFISYRLFFTKDLNKQITKFPQEKSEILKLFKIIWHNSRKLGLVFVGSYTITKLSLFLAGLYLPLEEVASYGLMMQFAGIISGISSTLYYAYQPTFASLRVKNNNTKLIELFAFSMNVFYTIFLLGSFALIFLGPWALSIIKSNAVLPAIHILTIYLLITLLENNHSNFATLIVTKNEIPFLKPALMAGGLIALGSYLTLEYTTWGLMGLVAVQGFSQVIYNNWKWPSMVMHEFRISFRYFIKTGISETIKNLKKTVFHNYNPMSFS